ncbi:MAG: hypothetical protein LBC64_07550 [Fibromonadaceae bacterium]|nr:hypothetical protein [Fibromonadaceae bacterium]
MEGINNISFCDKKEIRFRNRYDFCQVCMLGEFTECDGLIKLGGYDFCKIHNKYLRVTKMEGV